MIDLVFSAGWFIEWARRGPFGSHIDGLATLLLERGYSKGTVERKISLVTALGRWLEGKHYGLNELNEETVKSFVRVRQRRTKICRGDEATLRLLLDQLRSSGDIPPATVKAPQSVLEHVLSDYAEYLVKERRLSAPTVSDYSRVVRIFLSERFGKGSVRLKELCQADTNNHLQRKSKTVCPTTLQHLTAALRSFFTFLHLRGDIQTNLASAVPTVASWRLSTVPRFLTAAEIQQLLDSCDLTTAKGKRDYAILLLAVRLGLRAGELVAMKLDDINWDTAELLVRGKGQRNDRLPIPEDVGNALATYLLRGRPRCLTRHVFVRVYAPHREFVSSSDISTIVRQAIDRAGLRPACKGAHVLRHSLATSMLEKGASLTEIGEVLRHRCSSSTELYSKVALAALRALAQPWPEKNA
jgi:site-specific recombinase XerD